MIHYKEPFVVGLLASYINAGVVYSMRNLNIFSECTGILGIGKDTSKDSKME